MNAKNQNTSYPTEPALKKGELPDPFTMPGEGRVSTEKQWIRRSRAWRKMIVDMEYGGMPPAPDSIRVESLCHNTAKRLSGRPNNWSYRIHCFGGERPFSFCVRMLFPKTSAPVPVIIDGDGCWWNMSDEVVQRVIDSGCGLLLFNRTEMAEDLGYSGVPDKTQRSGGIYDIYPGHTFGALSAWAWGFHRCVDFLHQQPYIDSARVAVTGHSRGGKTALLAGVTDERITLVNDNASCAGGSPVFRYVGDSGETLNIINSFPSWFGSGLKQYLGREEDIPFDQHCLLATVAPRPLLLTFAGDDRWSNPEGMVQSAWAAREVYRFLDRPDDLAFHLRPGQHSHSLEDWEVLLDFIGWKWQGKTPKAPFNRHPYRHMQPAFSWRAPKENINPQNSISKTGPNTN